MWNSMFGSITTIKMSNLGTKATSQNEMFFLTSPNQLNIYVSDSRHLLVLKDIFVICLGAELWVFKVGHSMGVLIFTTFANDMNQQIWTTCQKVRLRQLLIMLVYCDLHKYVFVMCGLFVTADAMSFRSHVGRHKGSIDIQSLSSIDGQSIYTASLLYVKAPTLFCHYSPNIAIMNG